jgi:hypothetical protein
MPSRNQELILLKLRLRWNRETKVISRTIKTKIKIMAGRRQLIVTELAYLFPSRQPETYKRMPDRIRHFFFPVSLLHACLQVLNRRRVFVVNM